MKVMHIVIGLNVGGAELMLKKLVDPYGDRHKYRHTVVSLTSLGVVGSEIKGMGVPVISLGLRGLCNAPFVLIKLANIIRLEQPDVVQTWMYHADLLGGIASRFAGNRNIIWNIRNTDVRAGSGMSIVTALVMRICALISPLLPSKIVCVAEAAKKSHVGFGYQSAKIAVIPNGFVASSESELLELKRSARNRFDIPRDLVVIGSVGRFNPYKDHCTFVESAIQICREYDDVFFIMIGKGVDGNNQLLNHMVNESGFSNRFLFLGEQSNPSICFAAMDIFCLHSISEGFPNVVGEAMCASLPCVVTDVGDASALLGDCGIVVGAGDADKLSAGFRAMINMSKSDRECLGKLARERIQRTYSIEAIRLRYYKLYDEVVSHG